MKNERPMRNAFSYSMAQSGVGFVASWILATRLGVVSRGELAIVITPILLALQFGQVGAAYATQYFIASRLGRPQTVFFLGLRSVVLSGLAVSAVLALSASVFLREFPAQVGLFRVLVLTIPLTMVVNVASAALRALRSYRLVNWNAVAGPILRVGLLIPVQLVWGLTVTSAAIIVAAGPLLAGLPLVAAAAIRVNKTESASSEYTMTSRDFRVFQLSAAPGAAANYGSRFLDRLILGLGLVAPEQLGLYVLASSITEPATAVFAQVRGVFLTESAREAGVPRTRSIRRAVGVAVFISMGLVAFSILVPLIYGAEYSGSRLPLVILALAIPASVMRNLNTTTLLAQNRPKVQSHIQGLALVISIGLLFALAPALGAIGAALASFAGYWFAAGIAAWLVSGQSVLVQVPRWSDLCSLVVEVRGLPTALSSRRAESETR